MWRDTRCRFALAFAVCLVAGPAEAQFRAASARSHEDYRVEMGATFWTPKEPDVVMRFNAGPEIDIINLFEIEEKRFTEFRALVKAARKHKLRLHHVNLAYQKDKTFTIPATQPGQVAGVLPANADFTWDLWRVGYEWDVVSGAGGFIGVIGELKYNRIDTVVSNTPVSAAASVDQTAPVPAIGGTVRAYVSKNLSVTAEGTRFSLNREGDEHASVVDYDLYGTLNLGRNIAVHVGYKSINLDYAIDDDAGILKLKGPYWGGTIRF